MILDEIVQKTRQRWMPFISLIGPRKSGKSEILQDIIEALQIKSGLKTQGILLDLSELQIHDEEQMYFVLLKKIGNIVYNSKKLSFSREEVCGAKRKFTETIRCYLNNCPGKLILCFDHLDYVPHFFARSLSHQLREIRDQVDVHIEYERLGVIVAGAVSLFELRQDLASPYMQDRVLTLPISKAEEQQKLVKQQLADKRIKRISSTVLEQLTFLTGGERSFLDPLLKYLQDKYGTKALTLKNIKTVLENENILNIPITAFWDISTQIVGNIELRRVASSIIKGESIDQIHDQRLVIDRFQLSGLTLTVKHGHSINYPLRNGLLEVFLKILIDLLDKRVNCINKQSYIINDLLTLEKLRTCCFKACDLASVAKTLAELWQLLTRHKSTQLYFLVSNIETGVCWCFEYIDNSLRPIFFSHSIPGPVGWIAKQISLKPKQFVGSDDDFLYAVCKMVVQHLDISLTAAMPRASQRWPFSEVLLLNWFNIVECVKNQLSVLISQEIVKTHLVKKVKNKFEGDIMDNLTKVFVVHGRNKIMRNAMFSFLRTIGLVPLEWNKVVLATEKSAPSISEIIDKGFSMAQATVIVFTGDDEARLHSKFHSKNEPKHEVQLMFQPRANVLYEAGMAMGLYPERTVLVEIGKVKLFSDISGLYTVRLDNSTQTRQDLALRLKNAGCAIDISGTDWHSEGDFE